MDGRGYSFALETITGRDGERTVLRALHRPNYGAIDADWAGSELARRIAGGKRQPLSRAVGLHKHTAGEPLLHILDATAGLGRDGFTLAALGARVTLSERNSHVCALLRDAQRRAADQPATRAAAERIDVIEADTLGLFGSEHSRHWDVIYLDPMYPDEGKAALPSKEMQILRDLTGGDPDADELLAPALHCARLRVVVKRPIKAEWLANTEPSMSITGTQLRFDVYLKSAIRLILPVQDFHMP
jgi:16S rRNA (guanine1516-N2)-methyltransferase